MTLASRAESLGLTLRPGTMDAWILDELDARDVEGAEYDILARAARDGTLDRIDRLVLEWHEFAPGQSVASLAQLLGDAGFAVALRRQGDGTGILMAHR